jgi:hypothetical protein
VAVIEGSMKCRRGPGFGSRELGSSQGESPRVGCSKSRSRNREEQGKSIGSREREDRWIRTPSPIVHSRDSEVERGHFSTSEVGEVPREEARVNTWQNHKVGPCD